MLDCLIVGGDSLLGRNMEIALRNLGLRVESTTRRAGRGERHFLDLVTLAGLESLPQARSVALVAAETKFSVCAASPDYTGQVNVVAPLALAKRAIEHGARVLFFSSAAVHDGSVNFPSEDLIPHPDSIYGQQKWAAEIKLESLNANIAVLRPSKVIDRRFGLFCDWIEKLSQGDQVDAFRDMMVSPIYIDDVISAATALLIDTDETGVFQLSASDQISYLDIAQHIARRIGAIDGQVIPVNTSSVLDPEVIWLPASTQLNCARLCGILGMPIKRSIDAVDAFLSAYLPEVATWQRK